MLEEQLKHMRGQDAEASRDMFELAAKKLKLNITGDSILAAKIRELETEREMLRRRRKAHYEDIKRAAEAYSKSWCLDFASKFLKKLNARELRELVYSFLLDGDVTIPINPLNPALYKPSYMGPSMCPVTTLQLYSPDKVSHCLNWDFVGSDFLEDIYPEVYRRFNFDIWHSRDLQYLLDVGHSLIHPMFSPVESIRHFSITLSFMPHSSEVGHRQAYQEDEELREFGLKARYTRKVGDLSCLRLLKHVSSLQLRVYLLVLDHATVIRLEECLVPIIYDLKAKGAKIEVWAGKDPFERGEENRTSTFDVAREEWEEKIRTKSVFQGRELL